MVSPGGPAGPVTVENIARRQYSRNPAIAKRLFETGYFDSWGQDIDRMLAWAAAHNLEVPTFTDDGEQFSAIIFWAAKIEGLDKREILILELISSEKAVVTKELQRVTKLTQAKSNHSDWPGA